jgi:hypothetical protein
MSDDYEVAFSITSGDSTVVLEEVSRPDASYVCVTVVQGKGAKSITLRSYDVLRLARALEGMVSDD